MEEAERLAHQIVVIDTGKVIAQGSAAELKEAIGGDVLEVRVHDPADLARAAALLGDLGQGRPRTDRDRHVASLPTKEGVGLLMAAGRRFEEERLPLDDLGIRRPSLDDVFLSLTGSFSGDAATNQQELAATETSR